MIVRVTLLLLIGATLAGCAGPQSTLDPHGPEAARIAQLFWIFTAIMGLIWAAVITAMSGALLRSRREAGRGLSSRNEQRLLRAVVVATGLTTLILIALTLASFRAQGRLFGPVNDDDDVTIRVTGHQWWWEARYESDQPSQIFTTANELHIPVGHRISVTVSTTDVIHSFWVPALFGKMDLINGVENNVRFTANRPGVFRGQCAEFCGAQHAHMGLLVIAQSEGDFEAWRARQLAAAGPPASEDGLQVFLKKPCVSCHTIRGTGAGGRVGPDLTHLSSRRHLAAGTLPMTRGALAAWIVDPQSIKPGAHMPVVDLAPKEIHPLLDFLEGLK